MRKAFYITVLILFGSCSTQDYSNSINAVFDIYGGEVKNLIEYDLNSNSGKSYSHVISVKWPSDFPSEMINGSLMNIACVYYQNLPHSEKAKVDHITSTIEDNNSKNELEVSLIELNELEELYSITFSLFESIDQRDSTKFNEIIPISKKNNCKELFASMDRLKVENGKISNVMFKECQVRDGKVLITQMYYTTNGNVYNGEFIFDRKSKTITSIKII